MNSYSKRRKKFIDKNKKALVKNWLSSFVVTAVVVVAAVVINARTPSAEIINVEVFGSDIFYEVDVIDDDYSIEEGSLKIVAKSQTKTYSNDLIVGRVQGNFGSLEPNTVYEIQVVAKYGYGEGVLANKILKTKENYGGIILNWDFPDQNDEFQEAMLINVNVAYNDVKNQIKSVLLKYATSYLQPVTTLLANSEELIYESVEVLDFKQTVQLEIFAYETVEIFLILEAILVNDEVVVLDEISFKTPLQLHPSIYETDVGSDYIELNFYPDFYSRTDIVYYVDLMKDGIILDTKTVTYNKDIVEGDNYIFKYTSLEPYNMYQLNVSAQYVDESTFLEVKKNVTSLDLYTTQNYDYTITTIKNTTQLNVTITLNDPNLVLSDFYFYVYTVEEDIETYYMGIEGIIIDNQVVLQLQVSETNTYKVDIYVSKKVNDTISYSWLKIESITK